LELAGNGLLDLVDFGRSTPGMHGRTNDENCDPFWPIASLPNLGRDDPGVRFVDINGDGCAQGLVALPDGASYWTHGQSQQARRKQGGPPFVPWHRELGSSRNERVLEGGGSRASR
jgi:hypothetical protein